MPFLFLAPVATAQDIVVHAGGGVLGVEDGGPKDADGAKNGVVVWKAGAVHVVTGSYQVPSPASSVWQERLVIQPGAVVKLAREFSVDPQGRVTSWQPSGGFFIPNAEVRGVTFTDVRDDTVGGDTNQDGGATAPQRVNGLGIGGDGAVLEGSTLQYVTGPNLLGDVEVAGNTMSRAFIDCAPGSSPLIRDNIFDASVVDMRGCTGDVENNRFANGGMILLGPAKDDSGQGPWMPQSGTTTVSGNEIEGQGNVDVSIAVQDTRSGSERGLDHVAYRAVIRDNVLRGLASLLIPADAEVLVTGNTVTTSRAPLGFSCSGCTTSRVTVNGNRFVLNGGVPSSTVSAPANLWRGGTYIDAENNYWGDPSGPLDRSRADSLLNLRGKGFLVGDGVDYVPFVGGEPEEADALRIGVSASEAVPLESGRSVTFDVLADRVRLNSSTAATLYAIVRAGEGEILEGVETRVSFEDEKARFPPMSVVVPEATNYLSVEAWLAPDGSRYETHANRERFEVRHPKDAFDIWTTSVVDVLTGALPDPIAGDPMRVRLTLGYTLTTSSPAASGRVEVHADARVAGTTRVLSSFPAGGGPLAVVAAAPGTNRTVEIEMDLPIPLWDVVDQPLPVELHGKILMFDDGGRLVARASHSVPIRPAAVFGHVVFSPAAEDLDGILVSTGDPFFNAGWPPAGWAVLTLDVRSRTASGFRLQAGGEAWRGLGEVLDVYRDGDVETGINGPSGGPEARSFDVRRKHPLPDGARVFRNLFDLVSPDGIRVARVANSVPVLAVYERRSRDIPSGPSRVVFEGLQALLDVSSNQQAGTASVAGIAEPYTPPVSPRRATAFKAADYTAWEFVPLNRYWVVGSTLRDGTFAARIEFGYDPATDFPADPGFAEDSLVVAGLNPLSGSLEALPSTLDRTARTVSTDYSPFFETYVVASRRHVAVQTATQGELAVPRSFALESNYPNPFSRSTTLAFRTPAAGEVHLSVFDALGREIARPVRGVFPPGDHRAAWDGTDAAGVPVPSGVYLVRLSAGGFHRTRPVVLVR